MNPPKVTEEDYINFIIATPRQVTATEAASCQPEGRNAPAHDAFTRLLSRLEPDAEQLWEEAKTQIDLKTGILVLDDSTLDKPYSSRNAVREFEKILNHRGEAALSSTYPLAQLGKARATKDKGEYEKFFELWKEADKDMPALIEARKESEKLDAAAG